MKEKVLTVPNTKRCPLSGNKTMGIRSSIQVNTDNINKTQKLYASVQITNDELNKKTSKYIPVYAEEEEADIIIEDSIPTLKKHMKKVSF